MKFHGVTHGTPTADGIVQTFAVEGRRGRVSLATITFEEQPGRTLLHENVVLQSVEDRDAMVQSGMEQGVNDAKVRRDVSSPEPVWRRAHPGVPLRFRLPWRWAEENEGSCAVVVDFGLRRTTKLCQE